MTSGAGGLASNPLHGAPVAKEAVCVIVDEIIAWLVEDGSSVRLSDCKANCIGETLTKWAGRNFNTLRIVALRMAGGDAINMLVDIVSGGDSDQLVEAESYPESLQVIHGDFKATQV